MFLPSEYRDISSRDLLSHIFNKHTETDTSNPISIDAANPSNSLSRAQCRLLVRQLIAGLRHLGVKPGHSVAVHAYNSIYYGPLFLAIVGAGGVYVGSNPAYTEAELAHLFAISDVKFVFTGPELVERILPPSRRHGIPEQHILVFDADSPTLTTPSDVHGPIQQSSPSTLSCWRTLLGHGEGDWQTISSASTSKGTPAALLQTSGTTGLPKAASLSHYSFVAQSIMIQDRKPKPYCVRRLLYLPFFHAFAGPLANIAPLYEGIATYVMRRYDQQMFLDSVHKYAITESHMVNPIALAVLALPPQQQAKLDSLRLVWTAGAPLGSGLQSRLAQALHEEASVVQVLGMTECGWITTFQYPEKDLSGSCGRLMPNVEAKLKDFGGQDITAENENGEVWFRSVSRMSGYKGNETATQEMLAEGGWLRSGDVGFIKEGKWFIVDRAKDIIKVRGWQVSPAELEAVLLSHPMIRDAAVLGVDLDDERGELPRAYIIVEQHRSQSLEEPTDEDILAFMGDRLAKYKALAGGIERVDTIPRGPSGKILKAWMKEEALDKIKVLPSKGSAKRNQEDKSEEARYQR